jgi:hypothetical protein
MRTFSSTIQNLLNQTDIAFFVLIELNLSNNYYLSSLPYDIVYPAGAGGNTYIANSGIFEYDSPKFSSVVDRESYKIVITDHLDTMKTEIEANVVGKPVTVRVGFLDSNNDPILTSGEVLTIYKGTVDAPSISNSFDNKLVTFEGTSPMSDLDIVNSFISSKDGMKNRVANSGVADTSFDRIYGESRIKLKWGKI